MLIKHHALGNHFGSSWLGEIGFRNLSVWIVIFRYENMFRIRCNSFCY